MPCAILDATTLMCEAAHGIVADSGCLNCSAIMHGSMRYCHTLVAYLHLIRQSLLALEHIIRPSLAGE